eukprot:TRINITY_DN7989_c0_g1_i2.p1 TRINITY_DN7989_c0_g1~~TRINITY_DN7989_c0_g1_i2.p1  ORF type:complete len:306 (+),score=11.80 TRINITY_DN7989_c0_g1_i2:250-1167(+)
MDGGNRALCALTLALVALLAASAPVSTSAAPPAPVSVGTYEQLVAAMTAKRPAVVLTASIVLQAPLPNVTWSLDISGAPACKKLEEGMCRLDGRKRYRHFTVLRGGVLTATGVQLSKGNPRTGSGGAIWVLDGGRVVLKKVFLRFNGITGTTSSGGAIEVDSGAQLQASQAHFIRNYAGFGGAIAAASRAQVTADYCIFHRNSGSTAGGALSLIMRSTALVRYAKFYANTAGTGSIVQLDASTMTLCNPDFYNNNNTLPKTALLATQKSAMTVCGVKPQAVAVQTGSTVTTSCAKCARPPAKKPN